MSEKKEGRDVRDYLNDISEMIKDIEDFTAGISYEGFGSDKKTLYAVIRCFEVIGEAVKQIPDHVRREHPEIPWKGLAGMRDKLIHGYFGIDIRIVWDTIEEDLPPLKEAVRDIIHTICGKI